MKQVITVHADGTMSGLQRKPGQGVDLRQFGKADIQRASLIEWDAEYQSWYVNVLQEAGHGSMTLCAFQKATVMDWLQVNEYLDGLGATKWGTREEDDVLLLTEYDDAVKVEIAYLDALRLAGQH